MRENNLVAHGKVSQFNPTALRQKTMLVSNGNGLPIVKRDEVKLLLVVGHRARGRSLDDFPIVPGVDRAALEL